MEQAQNIPAAADAAGGYELVVVEACLSYEKGQIISEASKVNELLESEWSSHFVKKAKQPPADAGASAS